MLCGIHHGRGYIYIEREREIERERLGGGEICADVVYLAEQESNDSELRDRLEKEKDKAPEVA